MSEDAKKDRIKAITAWQSEHYDRITWKVRKGERDRLKEEAASRGLSLQGMIKEAVARFLDE